MPDTQTALNGHCKVTVTGEHVRRIPDDFALCLAVLLETAELYDSTQDATEFSALVAEKTKGCSDRHGINSVRACPNPRGKIQIRLQPGNNDTCYFCHIPWPNETKFGAAKKMENAMKVANDIIRGHSKKEADDTLTSEPLDSHRVYTENTESAFAESGKTFIEFFGGRFHSVPKIVMNNLAGRFDQQGIHGKLFANILSASGGPSEFEFTADAGVINVGYSGYCFQISGFVNESATLEALYRLDPTQRPASETIAFDYRAHESVVAGIANDPELILLCLQSAIEDLGLAFQIGTVIPSTQFMNAMASHLGHPQFEEYPVDKQENIRLSLGIKMLRHRLLPDGYIAYANGDSSRDGYVLKRTTPAPLTREVKFKVVKVQPAPKVEEPVIPEPPVKKDRPAPPPVHVSWGKIHRVRAERAAATQQPEPATPPPVEELIVAPPLSVTEEQESVQEAQRIVESIAEALNDAGVAIDNLIEACEPEPKKVVSKLLAPEEIVARACSDIFEEMDRLIFLEEAGKAAEMKRASVAHRVEVAPREADDMRSQADDLRKKIVELEQQIVLLEATAAIRDEEAFLCGSELPAYDHAIKTGELAGERLEALNTKLQRRSK